MWTVYFGNSYNVDCNYFKCNIMQFVYVLITLLLESVTNLFEVIFVIRFCVIHDGLSGELFGKTFIR